MRVAAYIRVSTDEQAEKGNSLFEQEERLNAYCTVMGWDKPIFYTDDGYSAGDLKRPYIKKLIEDIKSKKYDILLTTKLDRLSRNLLDLLNLIEMFSKYQCAYVSATESFDTSTAAGRMVLQLLGVFAEFERQRNSERVKDNMSSLAIHSDKALSGPCFGYDIVDKRYVINQKEAAIVLEMVELAEKGHGGRSIAKILNEKNALSKRGKLWSSERINRFLRTETIAGIRVFNKRKKVNGKVEIRPKEEWIIKENNHPPIIEPSRFWRLQDILDARKLSRRHSESETYLLTGVLKCGHCGSNMKGSTANIERGDKEYTYHRYICSSYVKNYSCKHHFIHRDEIETQIINYIKTIANTSVSDLKLKTSSKSINDQVKEIENQLTRLDHQMQRQIEAYGKELITDEDLKVSTERVTEERKLLKAKLDMLLSSERDNSQLKENIVKSLDDITNPDRKKAKAEIIKIIDKITITDDVIEIIWRA